MIDPRDFYELLLVYGVDCFCGVPDSLLKSFCAYLTDHATHHVITANEGNAVALACGHYLSTQRPALVYMQNSGLGNCVNPLLSLADEAVYNIPLLLLIGWRGEPGTVDEPQHIKQGELTLALLSTMGIAYDVLPDELPQVDTVVKQAFLYMQETSKPYALVVRRDTFSQYKRLERSVDMFDLVRETAIEEVVKHLDVKDVVVSTTGHISRELYEVRCRLGQEHNQDFLTVGSMGHSSSIALGIAMAKPSRPTYCFDGDGALLMHMGSLAVNAEQGLTNFRHVIFNNGVHDSVGGQPTAARVMSITELAASCGYRSTFSVVSLDDLKNILPQFTTTNGPCLLEIKVKCGARSDLGRPKEKPVENKKLFMQNLHQVAFCYRGAIDKLSTVMTLEKPRKVLILAHDDYLDNFKNLIESQLSGIEMEYYCSFQSNPQQTEIDLAFSKIVPDFDLIIALGGGSVIDFAKVFRYQHYPDKKIIAIPTTSGTGAEATHFAVVYVDGHKTSLEHESITPEYAIVDGQLSENNLQYLKACTAMDAYCQALESYWSVNSTPLSRDYARSALEICQRQLVNYVITSDRQPAQEMAEAAHLAGLAIDIAKTTASHALSYAITTNYGLPHGHAVALTIAQLVVLNKQVGDDNCQDPRGAEFVRLRLHELEEFVSTNPLEYFADLFGTVGLEMDRRRLGITDFEGLVGSVNEQRLKNNPVKLTFEQLLAMVKGEV